MRSGNVSVLQFGPTYLGRNQYDASRVANCNAPISPEFFTDSIGDTSRFHVALELAHTILACKRLPLRLGLGAAAFKSISLEIPPLDSESEP